MKALTTLFHSHRNLLDIDVTMNSTCPPFSAGLFIISLALLTSCTALKTPAQRNAPAPNISAQKLAADELKAKNTDAITAETAAATAANQPASAPQTAAKPTTAAGSSRFQTLPDGTKLYQGSGNFVKTTPNTEPLSVPSGETYNLNFEGLDIREFALKIMGDYLKETFTIHPQTTGTITIRMSQPVQRKDLIPILEMLLRQNGQIMVKEDGFYKIMPQTLGVRGSSSPQVAGTTPLPNGFSVQIVQLKFVGAADMKRILEPFAVEPASSIRSDDVRNLLILSGTQRELKLMLETVELFDVDFLSGFSFGLFPMQTDVKTLSTDLDKIFGPANQSPLTGIVRIIPIERSNSLMVITTQARYLEEAKKWIEQFDKGASQAGGLRLNVYPVQYGKAETLAQLLSDIYGNRQGTTTGPTLAPGQRPAQIGTTPNYPFNQPNQSTQPTQSPTVTPPATAPTLPATPFQASGIGVAKETRIIADKDNNSLLIMASSTDYETILSALKQLDVPRRQVKVEVLVAEVMLTDNLKFGVEAFIKDSRNNLLGSLRNRGGAGNILPPVLPTLPGTGNSDPRGPMGTATTPLVAATPGLQLINVVGGDIRGVIQALGDDNRATVISTPNITVLDNEKASINVGTKISVDTGTTVTGGTGGTVTSRQYIDTGVILNVTPRINAGGRVTLEINQEVSSPTDLATSNPNINTRKANTVVTVNSGETLTLAGLIQKNNSTSSQGIPLLSKIPLVGGLFGSQAFSFTRTELVILITPVVINNADEAYDVMQEMRKKLPSLKSYFPAPKPAS